MNELNEVQRAQLGKSFYDEWQRIRDQTLEEVKAEQGLDEMAVEDVTEFLADLLYEDLPLPLYGYLVAVDPEELREVLQPYFPHERYGRETS